MKSTAIHTLALLLTTFCPLTAATNGSEATSKIVTSSTMPFTETGTHPGNGQLWYVLDASAATQAAWYECSIQITSPASTAGYSIRIHDGIGTFDRSVVAQAGEKVRAMDFIAPGEGLYVTVDLNGATATPVSFRFDAIKRTIPAEPNPRVFNNAAPFTITGIHPGQAVEQEFRYTAPVAGSYTFTTTVASPSGWYLWDTRTALESLGDDRDLSMNRQPSVHTVNLTAGQVFSFWLGQVDLEFNPDGVPLDYTVAVTRQAPTDLLPPVVSFTSATPASGTAPFTTTIRLRLQDDLSGIDADGTAPHSTVSLKRGATVIASVNLAASHRVSGTALDGVYDVPLTIPAGTAAGTADVAVSLLDLSGRTTTATYAAVVTLQTPPPSNDNFANALTLTTGVTATGTNVGATLEPGETLPNGYTSADYHRTVWWHWTAPAGGGYYRISSSGSSFFNVLALYTGSSVNALVSVGDTANSNLSADSTRYFRAVPQTIYRIAVAGWGPGFTGNVQLVILPVSLDSLNYRNWKEAALGSEYAADTEDDDMDGLVNMMEFALGGTPGISDANRLPESFVAGGLLHLRYTRRKGFGLSHSVVANSTLSGTWSPSGITLVSTLDLGDTETVTYRNEVSAGARGFMRLEIGRSPE